MKKQTRRQQEKELSNKIGDMLKFLFMEEKLNPDKILIGIIKRVYGHKVDGDKFVKLIESSGF